MVIHSFAIYLPTSTFIFISSRRLRHSLEIQRSQNLRGSEIRGRRSKTKIRLADFSSARWGHVPFCRLFLPLVLMGSDSSGRLLDHRCCGVYGFSKFVSPAFIVHWVDLVGKLRFTSQQGMSFIFFFLYKFQIISLSSGFLICTINTNMHMLKSYKEVHVSMWCCDLDRTYTLQKTCVWKTWSLCDDSVGEALEAFEVASTKVTEGGGMWVFRDIFLMVLSSLSLFPVCCVFYITDCHNQDTLHKHMRPSRHGQNKPSGPWSKINLSFLKPFVLVTGSVLSNAVVFEDNDSHVIIPTFRHKHIYLI